MKIVEVDENNFELAIEAQAKIFPKEKSPEQVVLGLKTKNPTNYICFEDDVLVGIFGFYYDEMLPDHVLLNWYGIVPERRRLGFGRKLLLKAIEYAKMTGRKYLTVWTGKEENRIAVELYEKVGFEIADYCCAEDVEKLKAMGDLAEYVVCVYPLTSKKDPIDFEHLNLQISKQVSLISKFNN